MSRPARIRPSVLALLAIGLLAVLIAAPAPAQPPVAREPEGPPAGRTAPTRPEIIVPPARPAGHGWFTVPGPPGRGTLLMHLPPRTAAALEPGPGAPRSAAGSGSLEGVVRYAPGFAQTPEAIAWWHGRVYIALAPERVTPIGRADWQRRILTLSASRTVGRGIGGWEYPPGRPEVAATLPGRGIDLAAFGACRLGPAALIRHSGKASWVVSPTGAAGQAEPTAPEPGVLELVIYSGAAWRRLELPWIAAAGGPGAPSGPFWLSGTSEDLTLFAHDAESGAVAGYSWKLPARVEPDQSHIPAEWDAASFPLLQRIANADLALPTPELVCRVDGTVIAAARSQESGGEMRLFWLRRDRSAEEGPTITGVPRDHVVVPMDGSGRLAVVWAEPAPAAAGAGDRPGVAPAKVDVSDARRTGLQIREVSATTGKVLFAGPLRTDNWLSIREYQVLAFMLMLVMGSVIVFVLRAEPAQAAVLPQGVALAEPGRRFMAAIIDYVPAALLIEALLSIPAGTLLLPSQVISEEFSLWAWLGALAIAAVHCTVGEAFFGRSLGKLMTGCAVASVRRGAKSGPPPTPAAAGTPAEVPLSRPAFWQCAVRNVVRWGAPVLGIFILFDARRRHPGDLLARTMVLLTEIEEPA